MGNFYSYADLIASLSLPSKTKRSFNLQLSIFIAFPFPTFAISMETIINKVSESALTTIDLEEYYPKGETAVFDMKDHLFMGLILKEKDFRAALQTHDWEQYRDKHVAINCSEIKVKIYIRTQRNHTISYHLILSTFDLKRVKLFKLLTLVHRD